MWASLCKVVQSDANIWYMPVIPAVIFCKLSALGETFCTCTTWKSKNTLRLDINTFTLLHHFLCNPPAIEVNSTHMHTCISVQRSLHSQGCVTPGSITYVSTKSMQIDHSNDIECTIDCLRKKNMKEPMCLLLPAYMYLSSVAVLQHHPYHSILSAQQWTLHFLPPSDRECWGDPSSSVPVVIPIATICSKPDVNCACHAS